MQIISNYFEYHDLKLEKLVDFCTDGAPAMLGCRSGFATLVKEKKSVNFNDTLCRLSASVSYKNIIRKNSYLMF